MVEQVMFFALGFLVMGVFGLLFLPFYWRRAVRLSTQALERQIPLSMGEIVAERDALRATAAAKIRLVEIKAEGDREARARDMIELGRRAGEISRRDDALGKVRREAERLGSELARAVRAQAEAEAGQAASEKEIFDATGLMQRSRAAHEDLSLEHRQLSAHADGQRATIAALDTRSTGLELRLEGRDRALREAEALHGELAAAAAGLRVRLASASADREEAAQAFARLESRHATARALLGRARAQLDDSRRRRDVLAAAKEAEAALVRQGEEALGQANSRERELREAMARQAEVARASEHNLSRRIDGLREEVARLQGAAAATPPDADLAMLRQSIGEIGREMLRLHRALAEQGGGPPAQKLRALQAGAPRAASLT